MRRILIWGLSGALLAAFGCGARDELFLGTGGSTASASSGSGGLDCEPGGIRLCGSPCPAPDAVDCPGMGCTPAAHGDSLEPADMGACWPDIEEWVSSPCVACEDGEACLHRAEGGLWCVPFEVCATLHGLGRGDLCRYADKSGFTGQALGVTAICPAGLNANCGTSCLCGGACGECLHAERCVGRSGTQSTGLCVQLNGAGVTWCSPTNPEIVSACYDTLEYCATFRTGPEDQAVADQYGVCVPEQHCLAGAGAGLVSCYDWQGDKVAP